MYTSARARESYTTTDSLLSTPNPFGLHVFAGPRQASLARARRHAADGLERLAANNTRSDARLLQQRRARPRPAPF